MGLPKVTNFKRIWKYNSKLFAKAWEKTVTETLMVLSTEHKEADWPRDTLFMVRFYITGICDG